MIFKQVPAKLLQLVGDASLDLAGVLGFLVVPPVEVEVFYVLEELLLKPLGCDCHLVVLVLVEVDQESGVVMLLLLQPLADILIILDYAVELLHGFAEPHDLGIEAIHLVLELLDASPVPLDFLLDLLLLPSSLHNITQEVLILVCQHLALAQNVGSILVFTFKIDDPRGKKQLFIDSQAKLEAKLVVF